MDFRPDHKGLAELLLSPELGAMVASRARVGERWAKENAPVGDPAVDPHPGEFRDSIHVVEGAKSAKGDRVAALLVADAEYAAAVEFGNKHRDASRTLRDAIDVIEEF